ncbi:hypothetical protein CTI12_AA140450 [Artemisia annua]|uniref:Uncharacterized protein n=1 Tax=Artemisia annua TaxID=35608 RepID=A0A2U1PL90_ARTAN|nr:hypothetical protein CTI12_AA140450 [Artemisia annua]
MLFKWLCRFFHNPNALWVSVTHALHGYDDRLRTGWVASSLRREPRGGVETEQWEAISAMIQAFAFSPQQDRLRLSLDSSDEF